MSTCRQSSCCTHSSILSMVKSRCSRSHLRMRFENGEHGESWHTMPNSAASASTSASASATSVPRMRSLHPIPRLKNIRSFH